MSGFRLVVLGGAATTPNPLQGCSSYLVEREDERLLLDCGPDTVQKLRKRANLGSIDAILISHLHSDHTLDLVTYRYGLKYTPGLHRRRVALYMPPGGERFLEELAQPYASTGEPGGGFFEEVFDVTEYDPAQPLQVGSFTVEMHPTRHYIPCWAMRLTNGGGSLVYLADTAPQESLASFAHAADLLIAEATLGTSEETGPSDQRGHMNGQEAGRIAAEANVSRLLLTHLWFEHDRDATYRAAAQEFDGPIEVAEPGLTIEVTRTRRPE